MVFSGESKYLEITKESQDARECSAFQNHHAAPLGQLINIYTPLLRSDDRFDVTQTRSKRSVSNCIALWECSDTEGTAAPRPGSEAAVQKRRVLPRDKVVRCIRTSSYKGTMMEIGSG